MIKHTLTALALTIAPLAAQAGDACPIGITIVDLGAPEWLNVNDLLAAQEDVQTWVGVRSFQDADGRAISFVHPNSPMDIAGVTAGGTITAINGTDIVDEDTYNRIMDAASPADVLRMNIQQDGRSKQYTVTVGTDDPVPIGLSNALDNRDCTDGRIEIANQAERDRLHPYFYDANRTFRCHDAHIAMQEVGDPYVMDKVYILRGTRRIIIAMPHWGSRCTSVASLGGTNLTDANLLAVIEPIIGNYTALRQANP